MTIDLAADPRASRLRAMWEHSWRLVVGIAVGLAAFIFTFGIDLPDSPAKTDEDGVMIIFDILCALATFALYPLRRRFPVPIVVAIVILTAFSVLSVGVSSMAVVSLATRRKPLEIIGVSLLFIVSSVVIEGTLPDAEPGPWWEMTIFSTLFVGVLMLTGINIGGRRQLLQSLREQASSVEREKHAHIQSARSGERTRIAREMHDVLAHRLSLVALHAGALEYRSDLSPEATRDTATVIRDNAHKALSELREVLGMLRDPNTLFANEDARPQPTLGQLEELLEQSRDVGTDVELVLSPGLQDRLVTLPESTGRHLYRVVQEGLTNARRHAPGAKVELCLEGRPGKRIQVQLSNPMPSAADHGTNTPAGGLPHSGLGLNGLRERVHLAGGDMVASAREDGTFILKAWLPWQK